MPEKSLTKSQPHWLRATAVFAFLQAFSFLALAPRLGFYSDDWNYLEMAKTGGSLVGGMRNFAADGHFWPRLFQILYYPLVFQIAGQRPWAYQIIFSAFNVAEATLLFLLLSALLDSGILAFVASCLSVIYPCRIPVHIWYASSPEDLSQALILASLLLHWHWTRGRKTGTLLAGQFFYLWSLLCYESCAFMPLLLAGGLAAKHYKTTRKIPAAARAVLADMLPFVPCFLAGMWWQWAGAQRFFAVPNQKSGLMHPSVGHFFKVYSAGFECIVNRVVHMCWLCAGKFTADFSWRGFLAWGLATAAAVWLLAQALRDSRDTPGSNLSAAGVFIGGFLGAYLPYALSGGYGPQVFSLQSRVNGDAAWAFGILWAWMILQLHRRFKPLALALLTLCIGAFTIANWAQLEDYAKAWDAERQILSQYAAQSASWPAQAHIVLANPLRQVGFAPVFNEPWSFAPALRLTSGRSDITAEADVH